jgi:D-glycero-D-manno-heptose 1,7-bisphosphate phosphatase
MVSGPRGRPAVFLDRDGTVIELVDYLSDPDQVRLIPGAAGALKRLRAAGFTCVVVSNQSGVGRGMFAEEAVHAVHAAMARRLAAEGAAVDAVEFCPAAPPAPGETEHPDRKPNPGMLLRAARRLNLDLGASWMVGDSVVDVRAGAAAGCRGCVLVRTGKDLPDPASDPGLAYETAADLPAAADLILGHVEATPRPLSPPRRVR